MFAFQYPSRSAPVGISRLLESRHFMTDLADNSDRQSSQRADAQAAEDSSDADRHRIQVKEPRTVSGALAYDPATGDVADLVDTEIGSIIPAIGQNPTYRCLCGAGFDGNFAEAQEHLSEMRAHGHDVEPIAGSFEVLPFDAAFEVLEAVRKSPQLDSHEQDILNSVHSLLQEVQKQPEAFDRPKTDDSADSDAEISE